MGRSPRLSIVDKPLSELRPDPGNARTHSARQLKQIAASITEFGFVNPVLVDSEGQLIAGHGRWEAARSLGLHSVPAIVIDHLTPQQQRALVLADNKIALNAGWDEELLVEALQEIISLDVDFELETIGFETTEVDLLLDRSQAKSDPADLIDEPDDKATVTNPGDVWVIGEHRLICGSALALETFSRLMSRESAEMVITDPPFNVRIDGHVSGLGKAHHGEFAMASGEMNPEQFTAFLTDAFRHIARFSSAGAVVMAFMDWRHMREIIDAGEVTFTELLNLCVWNKTNGGMGSLYRSKHELVFVFKSGKGKHINNVELGRHGRYRTNVWDYAGANSFRRGRAEDLGDHPTVKPVLMITDAIKDCSRRGGLVLDPFGGSGTTLLAAARSGRRARLIELDPKYVDVALRRWAKLYPDIEPRLEGTSETFAETAARRAAENQSGEKMGISK